MITLQRVRPMYKLYEIGCLSAAASKSVSKIIEKDCRRWVLVDKRARRTVHVDEIRVSVTTRSFVDYLDGEYDRAITIEGRPAVIRYYPVEPLNAVLAAIIFIGDY